MVGLFRIAIIKKGWTLSIAHLWQSSPVSNFLKWEKQTLILKKFFGLAFSGKNVRTVFQLKFETKNATVQNWFEIKSGFPPKKVRYGEQSEIRFPSPLSPFPNANKGFTDKDENFLVWLISSHFNGTKVVWRKSVFLKYFCIIWEFHIFAHHEIKLII